MTEFVLTLERFEMPLTRQPMKLKFTDLQRLVAVTCLVFASSYCLGAQEDAYVESVVNATPSQAWSALTTKTGLESWMVAMAEVDWRIGGSIRTRYKADGFIGDDGTIENSILSFDEPRMYSIRIAKPPQGFPFMAAFKSVWSVVYFEPVAAGKTRVSIRMHGFSEEDESQKMREFFLRGNQYILDKLGEKFSR